jgi:hypothetical protein
MLNWASTAPNHDQLFDLMNLWSCKQLVSDQGRLELKILVLLLIIGINFLNGSSGYDKEFVCELFL